MKLKKWLKYIDPIVDVKIFGPDSEEPDFEGAAFNIPWTLIEHEIGKIDNDLEEPIYICEYTNEHGVRLPLIVINII